MDDTSCDGSYTLPRFSFNMGYFRSIVSNKFEIQYKYSRKLLNTAWKSVARGEFLQHDGQPTSIAPAL